MIVLSNKDWIQQSVMDLVLSFSGKRRVLSTSSLNGGMSEELVAVFNHCDKNPETGLCEMCGKTYEEHLKNAALAIGLEGEKVSGLSTAADLSLAIVTKESFQEYTVTAICSGGVLHNGRRAVKDQLTKQISFES